MNDHICKRIIKETAHVVERQIIIIFHSKLEPVEAAKTLCYTKVFTICPASFPKTANPPFTSSIYVFISKNILSKINHRSYKLGSTPYKMGHQIPFKMILHTCVLQLSYIILKIQNKTTLK